MTADVLLVAVAAAGCVLAAMPALLFVANLRLYRVPAPAPAGGRPDAVSLLIPARNEAAAIAACVEAALRSRDVELEVIVLDDHSEDETAGIVGALARRDPRVRLEAAPPLPPGWCGKQHACFALSRLAGHPVLAFIDADVRLAPDGLARATAFLRSSGAALVSGVPRQETVTPMERVLIPLIHFLLLGYLPVARMRRSTLPAYGAGCGQLFLTTRDAYERVGGHAAIRRSLHDGITLPRAYRRANLMTDLFDATPVATCRMYRSAAEVWNGLAKNATEGMATPAAVVPWTFLLVGGHVLPVLMLAGLLLQRLSTPDAWGPAGAWAAGLCGVAVAAALAVRLAAARRFDQPILGAIAHPLGVLLLVVIQWVALGRRLAGVPSAWRGRAYPAAAGAAPAAAPGDETGGGGGGARAAGQG